MRTSLHEIKQIEDHLFKYAGRADACVFEARLILEPALQEQMQWQQRTYELITQYSRVQFKAELETMHQTLFTAPAHRSFAQRIKAMFI